MAQSVERLRAKRETIRECTRDLFLKIETEINKTVSCMDELETLLCQLKVKEKAIENLDGQIEEVVDLESLSVEVREAQEFQDVIIKWKTRVTKRSSEIKNLDGQQEGSQSNCTVKLPTLTLEKYFGDPLSWPGFWNQFEETIHKNPKLSKVDKLSYLRSYLGGRAASTINGLPISGEGYDAAVDILAERFGRKDIIINAHMDKLLNLQPVRRSSDLSALRRLYDVCEVQVRSLAALGVATDSYGCLLCPVLMKAVPEDIALEFSRKRETSDQWNASEFIQFLRREIEGRERTQFFTKGNQDSGKHNKQGEQATGKNTSSAKYPTNKSSEFGSASALNVNANNNHANKCLYCSKENSHSLEECTELSLDDKRAKVKALGLCFICLGPRHTARFCKSRSRGCRVCKRWHHASLCERGQGERNETAVVSSIVPGNRGAEVRETVLLQTAKAIGKGDNGSLLIRFMLDSGSQRTFVEEKTSRALGLVIVGEEKLKMHTFGREFPTNKTFKRVRLTLTSVLDPTKSVEIEALESPTICSASVNIPGKCLTNKLSNKGIKLADISTGKVDDQKISLLIGADSYWKLVTGKVERLDECLVALETVMGWCVQGPTSAATFTGAILPSASVMRVNVESEGDVSDSLKRFWELDSLGISEGCEESLDDTKAVKLFESTVSMKNGRYEVKLPWKSDDEFLRDNFNVAQNRMKHLTKRFKVDLSLYRRYCDVIEEQRRAGIIEDVLEPTDSQGNNSRIYYMPHHAVIREEKSTKTRVVFDDSSHDRDSFSE